MLHSARSGPGAHTTDGVDRASGTGTVPPRTARTSATAAVAALLWALLAVLPYAFGAFGHDAAPGGPAAARVVAADGRGEAADGRGEAVPRVDDRCDTACTVHAAVRAAHTEHAAPRGDLAACLGTAVLVPPGPARLPSTAGRVAATAPPPPPDRGRSPPAPSGEPHPFPFP
ncbi:hypothetical protein [Streptomyces sp. SudanB182_2057]|uniref:hypothetical protein n=1 Tax=Streptomyces sp. SudanB182_2057 TaxID=3035281 RepID=UPI003F551B8C